MAKEAWPEKKDFLKKSERDYNNRTEAWYTTHMHQHTHTWPPPPTGGHAGGSSLLQRKSQACSWATHRWPHIQTGNAAAAAQRSAWPRWSVIGRHSSRTGSSPAPCRDRTRIGSWQRPWSWHLGNERGNTPQGQSGGAHTVRTVISHSTYSPHKPWQGWCRWVLTVRPVMIMPPTMSNSSDTTSWCRYG